jgi:hypothetical protein
MVWSNCSLEGSFHADYWFVSPFCANHAMLMNQIKCIDQSLNSSILSKLSPTSINKTGHVAVRPTLQLRDTQFDNIFAIGDVTDAKKQRNSRSAVEQAEIAAKNVVNSITGKELLTYNAQWWEVGIDLTLGLVCI